MDIIFQSGEFFNEPNILSTILGPLATLISVLISAYIGIKLFNKGIKKDRELSREQRDNDYAYNRKLDEERREVESSIKEEERLRNLNKFGNLFVEILNGCITTAKKQTIAYKEYAEELLNDLLGFHFPIQYPQGNLTRLLDLDIQKILNFFELKKATNKDFINTVSQLDFLSAIFNGIPNGIFEGNGKKVVELSNIIIQIRKSILSISTEYINIQRRDNANYEKDELYNHLNKMVKDYLTDNDGKPSVARDSDMLFTVIRERLLEEPFRYYKICNDLLNLSKDGSEIIFSIKQINEQQCKDLLITIDRINESIAKLEEILKKLM